MARLKFGASLCSLTELNWEFHYLRNRRDARPSLFVMSLAAHQTKVKPHVGVSYSIGYETDQFSVLQTFIDRGTKLPKSSQDKCMTPGK